MGTMGQSITLANSIIGVGILAMPFCFQQCGVLLATLILLTMGLISRLCCYFLLKSALLARRRNFEFLAFHVFGPAGKLAVEVGIIGFLMGTCIAYFVVVGDLGPQIISKMFNINQSDILRTSIMVIVSLVCVLPLGLLRNVDSLSNVSAATIGFYLCLVIKVIAEAASQLPSGEWRRNMDLWSDRPAGAVLQCVPIFSMALFCQTQLFEIFESLPSLSLEKMNAVTKTAINICTCVYFTLGLFGYIAFCSQDISGNILMSLSPTMANDVIKLGFVMSLAFSFPLIIFPCRASLYSFLYKKVHSSQHDHIINHSIPETTFRCITVGIIAVALVISLLIPNIELVLGLVGSTIGVLICVVFPAACFVNVTFKNTNERVLAKGVLILGLGIMILGTYANLQAAEKQIDKYDERFITQEKIDKIVEDFFEKREKVDGNHLKPVPIKDPVVDASKLADVKKDSEVQPPNPVPPESNSIELKSPETNIEKGNLDKSTNDKSVNDVILPEKLKEEAADTVSDTHPKNLKFKLNGAKLANGNNNNVKIDEKPEVNYENKVEKIKLIKQQKLIETIKQHGEEQKELMQEQNEILNEIIKNKKEINNEKPEEPKPSKEPPVVADNKHQQLIDTMKQHGEEQRELIQEQKEILDEIIKNKNEINNEKLKEAKPSKEPTADVNNKHQQLIETMKQHGEEQKELMKEQKEILDEIKEMKQNKNAGSSEANKIAVESIKQIADMAIKSIGDVTKKPVGQQKENKKSERLEKLTHNAVQEIAKKVEETIEAIKEIKEKPEAAKPEERSINKVENEKELPAILYKVETNQKEEEKKEAPVVNLNSLLSNEKVDGGKQTNINKRELQNAPLEPQSNEKIDTKVADPIPKNVDIKVDSGVANVRNTNLEQVQVQNVAPIANNVAEELNSIVVAEKQNHNQNIIKPHSHSPDEPQSYKVGEDAQIKNLDNALNQNVPLAVAMSDQAKLETNANKNVQAKPIAIPEIKQNIENSNNAKENIISNIETLVRQKRDAIIQKQYEKKSGQWHLQSIENSIDILPKVDLNDRLSRLPLDPNMLHISRSLKSYDEKEKDSDT